MLIRIPRPQFQLPDWQTRIGIQMAQRFGRSWWALRYTDGRIIHEWDADPGSPNGHADWPRIPYQGRQELRLYCPNGQRPTLGSTGDNTGRLFQFKVGLRTVAVMAGASAQQSVLAHIVGMIISGGYDGQCVCYAWEPLPEPIPPAGAPMQPDVPSPFVPEPVAAYERYQRAHAQWKDAHAAWLTSPDYLAWQVAHEQWVSSCGGRLVGPWDDNVYDFRYHQLGALNADVLGLAVGDGR